MTDKAIGPLFADASKLLVVAGPCVIESRNFALETAHQLAEMAKAVGVELVYKSSFDKANRSSGSSFRGVGFGEGLKILSDVRALGVPVVTDIHEAWQAAEVAQVVDMLQIPALLCRQSDLIEAAAATGKPVNFKKGQFLSPYEMASVIGKARAASHKAGFQEPHFFACERGTSFGYNNLVVDMRGLAIMAETCGCRIMFDATHSVQLPGAAGERSGGEREFAPVLARAALATGAVSAIFLETHPDPDNAPCDGPNMIKLSELQPMLVQLRRIFDLVRAKN
jgi:2-dehydro-3-deoxyphosphooctonate aldolase (KDO 8-P synthase)